MMRGSIIALIHEKSLLLDTVSSGFSPEGALTLIGTDGETITQGVVQIHTIWGGLLEITIGSYLIYRQLGAACAMPISVTFGINSGCY
jgi:ATP-binding cassette, subfamily C (CFTR/MRP), member 1